MRTWIAVTIIGLICVGAAGVIYGPRLARTMVPQLYLARAAAVTVQEFRPAFDTALEMLPKLQGEQLRHELTLGLNNLQGDLVRNLDPGILSTVPMLSLRNVIRRDKVNDSFAADIGLQMAATPIVNVGLHLDRERIAVNVPLLFDHSIIVNPHRLGSDLTNSVLGTFIPPGMVDDAQFYWMYDNVLFDVTEPIDLSEFFATLPGLFLSMEFEYLGRNEFDEFRVVVPAEQANRSWGALLGSFPDIDLVMFASQLTEDDIAVTALVGGGRLVGLSFELYDNTEEIIITSPEAGSLNFRHSLTTDIFSQATNIGLNVSDERTHQAISVNADTEAGGMVSGSAEIDLRLFPEAWRLEADVRSLSVSVPSLDIVLHARYMLMPDTEPILFHDEHARLLTDLNIFDLLGVYARIGSSPLGGILGNLLP